MSGIPRMNPKQAAAYRRHNFRFVNPKRHPSLEPRSYEYQFLMRACRMNAAMRGYLVRDQMCDTSISPVVLSPSIQAAYMRIFRMYDKGTIRRALSEMVPVLSYRLFDEKANLAPTTDAEKMLPEGQPSTLNALKKKLFQFKEKLPYELSTSNERLVDFAGQAKLRRDIKFRLFRFHRKIALYNAAASRSVLYDDKDAASYFLFRAPAMYAAMSYVLNHVSSLLPTFVPRSVLSFGTGTGTCLLVVKEIYNPAEMMHAPHKQYKKNMRHNKASKKFGSRVVEEDLQRLDRELCAKKQKRFLGVIGLLHRGEIELEDIPKDLRIEIMRVGLDAVRRATDRIKRENRAELRNLVSGDEWDNERETRIKELEQRVESLHETLACRAAETNDTSTEEPAQQKPDPDVGEEREKTWWERVVEMQYAKDGNQDVLASEKALKHIYCIEPSQGMMDVAMNVMMEELPNVHWRRSLNVETEAEERSDLVVAAYTFSEISGEDARRRTFANLWARTKGVLVIIESASRPSFDLMMQLRDAALELKEGSTVWDEKPTIIAPCPHEHRCPMRHSGVGVRRREMRVCHATVTYHLTFVERWIHQTKLSKGKENFTYLVIARNKLVPGRAERQRRILQAMTERAAQLRIQRMEELKHAEMAQNAAHLIPERASDEVDPLKQNSNELIVSPVTESPVIPTTAEWVPCPQYPNRYGRYVVPRRLPVPAHRYNRLPSLDVTYRRTRMVNSNEVRTIRTELEHYREALVPQLHEYCRVVTDPVKRGHIWVDLCTPEGDLIRAKVFRRPNERFLPPDVYRGLMGSKDSSLSRWQMISGWFLLRRSRRGALFPFDVPLYAVQKYRQIDSPNTLVDERINTVESTAMKLGDIRGNEDQWKATLENHDSETVQNTAGHSKTDGIEDAERSTLYTAVADRSDPLDKVKEMTRRFSGLPYDAELKAQGVKKGGPRNDSERAFAWENRTKVSPEEWARVVQGSKRRIREILKQRKLLRVQQKFQDPKKTQYTP